MFFVDAIRQQYFIPIIRKLQHFLSQIQSFMFSFMQSNQNFIIGKHSTMVENSIENTWCRMLEGIFDFSSFENNIEISKSVAVARKIRTIIFSKWLVDEELAKNSSLQFELVSKFLSSIWINQHHCCIKRLQDQHENADQNRDSCISQYIFIGALDLWLKLYFNLHLLQFPKERLKLDFESHRGLWMGGNRLYQAVALLCK